MLQRRVTLILETGPAVEPIRHQDTALQLLDVMRMGDITEIMEITEERMQGHMPERRQNLQEALQSNW